MKSLIKITTAAVFVMALLVTTVSAMPYSTDSELYDQTDPETVIQLTDDDNTGSVDQTILDNKRADAHELINTYLRGRYSVPVEPTPKILANIERDLLVHSLYTRRPNYEIPESVLESKKDAMQMLKDINRGNIELEDQPDVAESLIVTNKKTSDRKFGDDTLSKF